jgi:uncharacterized protein involved in cysteine biosynthesis
MVPYSSLLFQENYSVMGSGAVAAAVYDARAAPGINHWFTPVFICAMVATAHRSSDAATHIALNAGG